MPPAPGFPAPGGSTYPTNKSAPNAMAHFWFQDTQTGDWAPRRLDDGAAMAIARDPLHLVAAEGFGANAPLEVRCPDRQWVLLAASQERVLVNGQPLVSGIRTLRDRDELVLDGGRMYFSTEDHPAVVPFAAPGNDPARKTLCARCKAPVAEGSPAVRCPGCGAWHHQDEESERPCWTYAATCALCSQPTPFAQEFQWSPAEL